MLSFNFFPFLTFDLVSCLSIIVKCHKANCCNNHDSNSFREYVMLQITNDKVIEVLDCDILNIKMAAFVMRAIVVMKISSVCARWDGKIASKKSELWKISRAQRRQRYMEQDALCFQSLKRFYWNLRNIEQWKKQSPLFRKKRLAFLRRVRWCLSGCLLKITS